VTLLFKELKEGRANVVPAPGRLALPAYRGRGFVGVAGHVRLNSCVEAILALSQSEKPQNSDAVPQRERSVNTDPLPPPFFVSVHSKGL